MEIFQNKEFCISEFCSKWYPTLGNAVILYIFMKVRHHKKAILGYQSKIYKLMRKFFTRPHRQIQRIQVIYV